jgi:carbonic anhydrase
VRLQYHFRKKGGFAMQWFKFVKIGTSLLSGIVFVTLIAWGSGAELGRAETGVDKRIEEFKAGMHKSAPHGEEGKDATAAQGDDEKKPAAHAPAKTDKPAAHAPAKKEKPAAHAPAKKEKHAAENESGHKSPAAHAAGGHGEHFVGLDPDEAFKQLTEGNKRFVSGHVKGPNRSPARRAELAGSQHPIAVIVSCSDSRVPPELLFDQGFGDIFVVRTAGNIVDSIALGSIEYAVDHLGTKLVVVLGHKRCGAVTAAMQGGDAPGNIKTLVETIKPAIEKGKAKHAGHGDLLDTCVKTNVKLVAEKIRTTAPILSEAVDDGMLRVIGAHYDLDSGLVSMTYNPR